jgi:hypothetical protein
MGYSPSDDRESPITRETYQPMVVWVKATPQGAIYKYKGKEYHLSHNTIKGCECPGEVADYVKELAGDYDDDCNGGDDDDQYNSNFFGRRSY